MPDCGPKREAPCECRYRAVPGSTSTTCAGSTGSEDACVVVIIVCPMPAIVRREHRRRPRSSSESTSSKSKSGRRLEERRLRQQQRQHRETLLALRAVLAKVSVAACDQHVVEMRAPRRSCRARGPARGAPRDRRPSEAPRRTRAVRRASRAHRHAQRTALQARRVSPGGRRQARRRVRPALAPRLESRTLRKPELDPPQRCVSLRKRREVVLRQRCAGGKRRASVAVEVRAAGCRSALHDRRAIGSEDERRDLPAKRVCRRKACAVQSRFLRLSLSQRERDVDRRPSPRRPLNATRAAVSPKRMSCASWRVRGEKPWVPSGATRAGSSCRHRSVRRRARRRA